LGWGNRSFWPSAQRYSIAKFSPAFPRRKLKNCVRRLNEDLRHPRVFAVRSVAYRLAHVFSEAIKHKSFEMDAERIRNLRFADERTGETVWI